MRLSLLLSLSLLPLSGRNAGAQLAPADDFFNTGAQFYISNNLPSALEKVESGLKFYPDDVKLKKLEQLLKQQQQQQQQQQQSQPNQQQKNQPDQSRQQPSPDQKNQQPDQASSRKNSQDQQQDGQKQAEQKKTGPQQQPEQEKNADGQPLKPGQMTPEEAKRLLDAQKDDEQMLQFKPPEKPRDNLNPVKDW